MVIRSSNVNTPTIKTTKGKKDAQIKNNTQIDEIADSVDIKSPVKAGKSCRKSIRRTISREKYSVALDRVMSQRVSMQEARERSVELRFIHINDLHGYVTGSTVPDEEGIVGGIDRAATEVKRLKEKNPEGTIILDGGDTFDGGFYSKLTGGKIVTDAYKEMGVEVGVIGNHDLSWGLDKYSELAQEAEMDFLGANVTDLSSDGHLKFLKPYTVLERKGVKIGILGITTPMTELGAKGKIEIEDPRRTTEKFVKMMRKKDKVDMVVVLSHLGYKGDLELANKVKGIDLIIGADVNDGTKRSEKTHDTRIVQAGGDGKYLGNLSIKFDPRDKKIISSRENLIPLREDIKPDPEMKRVMAPYVEKYVKLKDEVLGSTSVPLPLINRRRTSLQSFFVNAQKKDSHLSLSSSFSIRKGINKGEITCGELFEMYPFDNDLHQVRAKGKDVINYLESGLYYLEEGDHNSLIVSDNFSYAWNPELIKGNKILTVNINGCEISRKDFEKMDLTVSMDDYTHSKEYFSDCPLQKNYGRVFDSLKSYITDENPKLENLKDGTEGTIVSSVPDPELLKNKIFGVITKKEPVADPTEDYFTCASKFYGDAIREQSGADISFGFNKTIRTKLPEGVISDKDLKQFYPFSSRLSKIEVNGTELLMFLEYARQDRFKWKEYITSSGITYKYDNSKDEGLRITSVNIGGKEYSPDELVKQKFTVAVDNFLKEVKFSQNTVLEDKGFVFDALKDYLRKHSPLNIENVTSPGVDVSSG